MSEKLGLFDIINNIYEKKGGFLSSDELKSYQPYMVNRALSQHKDLVFLANELNSLYNIDKDMHYAFLYHGVPKKRRYGKWAKNEDDKDKIAVIQEYYGYSYCRAKEVLPLLIDKISELEQKLTKGGKGGKK
jgi:hypothetical protein